MHRVVRTSFWHLVQAFWLLPGIFPQTRVHLLIDTGLDPTQQLRTGLRVDSEWKVGDGGTRNSSEETQEANELGCGHRPSDGPARSSFLLSYHDTKFPDPRAFSKGVVALPLDRPDHRPQRGLGAHVPFLRKASQHRKSCPEFPKKAGPVGHSGPWRCPSVCPRSGGPGGCGSGCPAEVRPWAAAQPSEMLNSSRMRGVAKGCMSWMRSSRWVCWALMLRSSVSIAMIFRNRNRWPGWGRQCSM